MAVKQEIVFRARDMASGKILKVAASQATLNKAMRSSAKSMSGLNGRTNMLGKILPSFGGAIRKVTGAVFSLKTAFVGLLAILGLRQLVGSLIRTSAEFEKMETQLMSLQGSMVAGQDAMKFIQDFAEKTPLQLQDVTHAFIKMRAFGMDPMDGSMQAIVDQTAKLGGGQRELGMIVLAVGQMWTEQKVRGQEVRQLMQQAVPVWQLLAKGMGKNVEEIKALSEAGKLGADAVRILIREMGAAAAGSSLVQMSKFNGLWTNFLDQVNRAKDAFTRAEGGLLAFVKAGLDVAIKKLKDFRKDGSLVKWGRDLGFTLIEAAKQVLLGTRSIISAIRPIFSAMKSGVDSLVGFYNSLPPWMRPLGVLGAIVLGPEGFLLIAAVHGPIEAIVAKAEEAKKKIDKLTTPPGERNKEALWHNPFAAAAQLLGLIEGPASQVEKAVDDVKLAFISFADDTEEPLSKVAQGLLDIEKRLLGMTQEQIGRDWLAKGQRPFLEEQKGRDIRDKAQIPFTQEGIGSAWLDKAQTLFHSPEQVERRRTQLEMLKEVDDQARRVELESIIRQALIEDAIRESKITATQEMNDKILAMGLDLATKQIQLIRQTELKTQAVKDQSKKAQITGAFQLGMALLHAGKASSKAIFIVTKAAAVASILVSTHAAAALAKANPPGPPLTLGLAAAVTAAGYKNAALTAAIGIAQGIGAGRGGGTSIPSGGGTPSIGEPQVSSQDLASRLERQPTKTVNVFINGDLIDMADLSRKLTEADLELALDTI